MTPVVLLPGMMCDPRLFAPQLAVLGARRAVQVATVTERDSIGGMAGCVLAHAPPRFALAGLSLGGIVAMEVIRRAPDRVERLALMDTNPLAEAPEIRARRGPQIDRVRAGGLREVMRDEMKPNYLAETPQKKQILDLCMDMAENLGPDVFVRQSVALRDRCDRQASLRKIAVPTLILCGRDDRLCPVERHRLMHGLVEGSRLRVIDGAGHLPTLEQPRATAAALCDWLDA